MMSFVEDVHGCTCRQMIVYIQMNIYGSAIFFQLRCPEGQVVPDQLHDRRGILVLVLFDLVNVGDSIIEGFLCKCAGFLRVIPDFIVEHRVVEGQPQSDGVGGLQLLLCRFSGAFVGLMGVVTGFLVVISSGVLGDVSVVVTLHLVVEHLGFGDCSLGQELVVDKLKDIIAVLVEFSFNLAFVASEEVQVLGALGLFLLLDGRKGSPGSSSGANSVLVGDGKKVSLLDGEVSISVDDSIHGSEHVLEPLGLLGDLGHIEMFFSGAGSHNLNIPN